MTQFLLIIFPFLYFRGMGSVILSVKDWSISFGNLNVLKNVHFNVVSGEIFGVIGVSGVGKTTLLSSLTTLLRPDSGKLFFDFGNGLEPVTSKNRTKYKSLIGFSSQEGSFYPELSVEENLSYFASLYSVSHLSSRISEVLKLVSLSKFRNVKASKLSGGMQKRLDIACAIIHKPKLLFLDEPTADLDPMMRARIWDTIHKVNDSGTTIIVASHFLDELEASCDTLSMIHNRHFILMGSVSHLKSLYSNNKEVHFRFKNRNYSGVISHLRSVNFDARKMVVSNGELVVLTSNVSSLLYEVSRFVGSDNLQSVSVEEPSVKEIFESLINSEFGV